MAKALLKTGSVIDGFTIGERVHAGGMATLWAVTHPDHAMPMLMKVPKMSEGEDPAAVVSFEMEQMILPRLTGPYVPHFVATGDLAVQPYLVMERIAGEPLRKVIGEPPLAIVRLSALGHALARALDDLHRQNVVHLDIKPENLMMRPSGEIVLLDFGLSHHDHLPDLMQEEFRLPFGTAPFMAPEQLLGVRDEPRSDLFALGVLLYYLTTGHYPFGTGESMRVMKRRLWRDPVPPRKLRPDCPPWLQEIILRCIESEAAWRYPSAAQLAFDLSHPELVKLTARSERMQRDPFTTVLKRRFNQDWSRPRSRITSASGLAAAPIVAVAVDVQEGAADINEALRITAERILSTLPSARLACLNVLKINRLAPDTTLDEDGNSKHIDRLVALRHWAQPMKLEEDRLTVHMLEAVDPAAALLEFLKVNRVDHILLGARQDSLMRTLLGSVSAKVAAEAPCTVTVVRRREFDADMPAGQKG